MKHHHFVFVSVLVAALVTALTGCGPAAPKGFPKTVPFNVVVTKGGTPVTDAVILLKPSQKNSWSATGKTDASGTASMRTMQGSYVKKGVPTLSYTVMITKIVDVSSMVTTVNDGSPASAAAYAEEIAQLRAEHPSEVPDFLGAPDTSPIETAVDSGTKELKIELDNYAE